MATSKRYGREQARSRIRSLLDGAHTSCSAALIISGEAGIGKSVLLDDARQQARGLHFDRSESR